MKRLSRILAALLAALLVVSLTGCEPQMPASLDEDEVLAAGKEIVLLLTSGKYEEVHGMLREDIRESTNAEEIQKLIEAATKGVGAFKEITGGSVAGMADSEIPHAVAAVECKYEKRTITIRVAIDENMNFIGLAAKKR